MLLALQTSINKWFQLTKDPVAVLERDPDIILRAQDADIALEPVTENPDGTWSTPLLNYR